MTKPYDVVVIGAGPNGLAAAVELARNDRKVLVVEGRDTIGGGARTAELTLPGFRHDVCSAVHPLGRASPFLRSLPLERHGLEWVDPSVPLTHVLEGESVSLYRSVEETASGLGADGPTYRRLVGPMVANREPFFEGVLGPVVRRPSAPVSMARFGLRGFRSASRLVRRFSTERARALFGGLAAHAATDLDHRLTGAIGLTLAVAGHTHGFPFARGGSQAIVDALAGHLAELGGEIATGTWVSSLADVPEADAYLLDLMPHAAAQVAGSEMRRHKQRKAGKWRHGPGSFKVDYALSAPVPWRDPAVLEAGTVHIGGTFEEVATSEAAAWRGDRPERPFVLLAQPTLADPSRSPNGTHIVWAYAHVPNGFDQDAADAIEAQIERFAPGFTSLVLERHSMSPTEFEEYNPNNVGGDIGGGAFTLAQVVARPRLTTRPYRMGKRVYLCSSATPPGAGVHGMCGYHAAQAVIRDT